MEVWKDIPMYVGIYEVSNLGRVRSKITGTNKMPNSLVSRNLKYAKK